MSLYDPQDMFIYDPWPLAPGNLTAPSHDALLQSVMSFLAYHHGACSLSSLRVLCLHLKAFDCLAGRHPGYPCNHPGSCNASDGNQGKPLQHVERMRSDSNNSGKRLAVMGIDGAGSSATAAAPSRPQP